MVTGLTLTQFTVKLIWSYTILYGKKVGIVNFLETIVPCEH